MTASRRTLLTAILAAGALEAVGCSGRVNRRSPPVGLDRARLAQGFAGLAERARPSAFDLGVMTLDTPAVWCADGTTWFPMRDLFMAPLAAAALAEVDAGRLRLNETLRVAPGDLSPPPSRVNRLFSPGDRPAFVDIPVADLIALAVQEGDNTAADSVMRRIGGPGAVTAWLQARGVQDMRIDRYAREVQVATSGLTSFRSEWKDDATWAAARGAVAPDQREAAMAAYLTDPRDTTTLPAILGFLAQLSNGALLSPSSTSLMLRLMSATTSGKSRLAAGLPAGASLAHKTGSSPTDLGLTPATCDVGLVTMANGRRFAVAAFLSGSTATEAHRDSVIADAARLAVSALI